MVILFCVYLVLVVFTAVLLVIEKDSLRLNKWMKFKVLFYNPLFLAGYVKCLYLSIKSKNLIWERIPHTVNSSLGEEFIEDRVKK